MHRSRLTLEDAFEAGGTENPGILLSREQFLRARAASAASAEIKEAHSLPADAAGDFFLATACTAAVPGAWEELRRRFAPRLHGLLRRRGASGRESGEILADLEGDLCAPPAGGAAASRLATYSGEGPLFHWLGVIVLRRFADRIRRRIGGPLRGMPLGGSPEGLPTPADSSPTPLRSLLDGETVRLFEGALREAWRELTPRETLALLLKYRDGLPQVRIATVLGVGEPRVAQLLRAGVERLQAAIRGRLRDSFPGAGGRDEALWRALEAAIAKGLATFTPPIDLP